MSLSLLRRLVSNHEEAIVTLAYNRFKQEVFTAAQGEKNIHVWDARTGKAVRKQKGHKGCITGMLFYDNARVLFSLSLDGFVMLWCDRGFLLNAYSVGVPLFSIALSSWNSTLAIGAHRTVHLFRILEDQLLALNLESRSVFACEERGLVVNEQEQPKNNPSICVLERIAPVLKGPEYCNSNTVELVVITDTGKLITGGSDACLCFYDVDKPKESYKKISKAHGASISSLAFDNNRNVIVTGAFDGSLKVWSTEGRCVETFENISDGAVKAAYVPSTQEYWVTGRGGQLKIIDAKGPVDITDYVPGTKGLTDTKGPLSFTSLHAPANSNILIGATTNKKILIWRYEQNHEYRIFKNPTQKAFECLVSIPTKDAVSGAIGTEIITGDIAGFAKSWKEEAEKCSDIYQIQTTYSIHKSFLLCMAYIPQLQYFVAGGEDGTVVIFQTESDSIIKSNCQTVLASFREHTDKVAAIAVIGKSFVVTGSYDHSLRVWDAQKLKCQQVILAAHNAAIQCISYSAEMDNLASCAMNHLVKIWSIDKTRELSLLKVLNHRIYRNNLSIAKAPQLVTTANINGELGFQIKDAIQHEDLIENAILYADIDVPEVTQVHWVAFHQCWITTSNDDLVHLWNANGELLRSFLYKGGPVQSLFVDETNHCILIATLDKKVSILSLDNPMPVSILQGHDDVVRCITYIPEQDLYITGSWDGTLRLWHRSQNSISESNASLQDADCKIDSKKSAGKVENELQLPTMEPFFLDADYTQLWKTLALMEEYETTNTCDWQSDTALMPRQEPLDQAPAQLEKLLDDINQRTLDQLQKKPQSKRQKSTLKRNATIARMSRIATMRQHN